MVPLAEGTMDISSTGFIFLFSALRMTAAAISLAGRRSRIGAMITAIYLLASGNRFPLLNFAVAASMSAVFFRHDFSPPSVYTEQPASIMPCIRLNIVFHCDPEVFCL
jgi:hypothetical protein